MAEWTHHRARLNGLDVHYVEQGHGPTVLLLHGFPHTWFSWRHQIGPLAEAGYRVVAPDLRGMGQTSGPEPVEEYRADRITADLCALLDHLGVDEAVCSGLDFGMFAAYDLALDQPKRVRGLIGLQNPFQTASDVPPLDVERRRGRTRFNHVSYFVDEPEAAVADMDAHPREMLAKIFHALSGEVDFTEMWRLPPGTTYRAALPEPPPLPWSWLSERELQTYVDDYARSGFGGGIRWYLALDLNWRYRRDRTEQRTRVPFYFLGSDRDVDLAHWHGANPMAMMSDHHADVRDVRIVPSAGHVISMEQPDVVNTAFLEFLRDMTERSSG
ncbi:alpha/beta fold hydrolase [Pseudonocardia spinosispora]|uniref:alpha/beta fold hydrolase n=1 Tax=Pseudonocardia spinosispora TaxID=103441 RepID=UPI0003FCA2BF|nr:alpha/beta hydrolase [Pseudonocardia spinosispora]